MNYFEPSMNAENSTEIPETPRIFGANNDELGRSDADAENQDHFTARWWPGEMQQRMPPQKPR